MRTIEWTSAFKRDYKRVKATPRHKDVEALLPQIAVLLAENRPSTAITLWAAIGKTIANAT